MATGCDIPTTCPPLLHRPDAAVVDLQMPVVDGISVVTELLAVMLLCHVGE